MNKLKTITKKHYSFKKAFDNVKFGSVKSLREDLQNALGVYSRPSWSRIYNYGIVSPRIDVINNVESVFNSYGIKECWEIEDVKSKPNEA